MAHFLEENPFDVLLIQDPPEAFRVGKGFVRGFDVILPSRAAHVLPSPSDGPLTAIVARTSLHVQPIHFCHRRLCGIFVSTRRGPIAFISAYFQFSDGAGLQELPSLVSLARQKTSLVLIGADSNGHSRWWGPPTQVSNALGERVEDFILTEHFVVENEWPCPPTYTSDHGFTTWIDLTLASPRLSPSVTSWRVLDESSFDSDHSAVTFTITLTPDRVEEERLDWRHVRWDSFRLALSDILESRLPPLAPIQSSRDVEPFAQALATTLSDVVSHHVPTKRMSVYLQPWWSPRIDELHSAHNRARRRWKRTHSRADKRVANECKRALRRAIIDAKRSCWRQFCEDTSSADLWDAFRRVMRNRRATRIQDLMVDGEHISDEDGQAHAFADRFFPPVTSAPTSFHSQVEHEVEDILQAALLEDSTPVTREELHHAIHASGPWKAPGPDSVPNILLRQCEDILAPYLLSLFSASIQFRHVPASWKEATVVAVPKPGGDETSPKGYRPISLISCISKVLERIVTDRLTFFLESRHLLSEGQFGFRKGRSTEDALWHLVTAASVALQRRQRLVLVSLDIQSAYDRVWHAGLLRKLATLGIPPDLLGWIGAFLADRIAHVRVGSSVESRHLDLGVPQGSPLSPILFVVFIDDLLRRLREVDEAMAQAFADDLISWWLECGADSGDDAVGLELSSVIETWGEQWRMMFNPAKCKILAIGRPSAPPPSFALGGVDLECVPHLRYLGVWLDSSLSWVEHIRRVCQRALDRLRTIHRGVGTMWGFHPLIVRRLIDAAVLPSLFYAAPVWCSALRFAKRLAPLDRVIRLCGISTMGLLRTVSHEATQMIAGILPSDLQLRQRVVDFYLRRLTYGEDVEASGPPTILSSGRVGPLDILRRELRHMHRHASLPSTAFQGVETRPLWPTDPSTACWEPRPSILDREAAMTRVQEERPRSTPEDLWIFTDGSVVGSLCGAAAVFFVGAASASQTFAARFVGHHSSTQAELVALRIGCRNVDASGAFRRLTFVSDSQPALLGVGQRQGGSALAVEVRTALQALHSQGLEIRLWWTPSHVGLQENELADEAAKQAALHGALTFGYEPVPHCRTALRRAIRQHYASRFDLQWADAATGRDLFSVMPHFTRSLSWTEGLHRREVALVAQFLTGHYATNAYLFRFGSRAAPSCDWCEAAVDDRDHRLFSCPRFAFIRQQLASEVLAAFDGAQDWTWEFLLGPGRRYLARFLLRVRVARV